MFVLVRLSVVFGVLVLGTTLGGCATIVHGSRQNVSINSNPPGAAVYIDNGMALTTPSHVNLERKRDYIVTISKPGYQTQTIPLNSVLTAWLAGNIIFGGIIGGGVDLLSGAAWTLTPENINLTLTPLAPGQQDTGAPSGAMTTQQKLEVLERLHKEGVVNDKEYEASKAKLNEEVYLSDDSPQTTAASPASSSR